MAMNQGLGLSNALDSYQAGVAWKQQQDETARVLKQRSQIDEANQAAAGVLDGSKAEWAMNGAQGQYRPNDATMFKAAEARGAVLAKHGMWDQFLENEARVAPMRIRARASAMQRYQTDGDIEALARAVYPTIFDGKEITSIEKVPAKAGGLGEYTTAAADSQAANGEIPSASPAKLRIKTSGSDEPMEIEPARLVQMVQQSLIDPTVTAKNEIMLNFERAKAQIQGDKEVRVINARGSEARTTEGQKSEARQGLADTNNATKERIAEKNNASRERVGAGHDEARVDAASVRAAAGGGSGGASGERKVQKVYTGADGNMYATFKDGTTKPLEVGGKPVASGDYGNRIDAMVKQLRSAPGNFGKSEQDLRSAAQDALATPTKTAPVAGLGDGKKDYSGLWTK